MRCSGNICYDLSPMVKFLNQKSIKESLGVEESIEFVPCNWLVHQTMLVDWMNNFEVSIPALLEDGIQVLIYAGEYDLLCNWLGNS